MWIGRYVDMHSAGAAMPMFSTSLPATLGACYLAPCTGWIIGAEIDIRPRAIHVIHVILYYSYTRYTIHVIHVILYTLYTLYYTRYIIHVILYTAYTLYYTRYADTTLGCLGVQLSTRLSVCKQFRVSQIGFITLHFPHLNIAHFHDI